MTIAEILSFEKESGTNLHLFKDRIFWQAYEKSAYLFSHYFKKYKVNYQFYKNISFGMARVGFPETQLNKFMQSARDKGLTVTQIDSSHIVFSGLPAVGGFDDWKRDAELFSEDKSTKSDICSAKDTLLFKKCFDFAIYILKLVKHISKGYKFSIGQPMAVDMIEIAKETNAYANHISELPYNRLVRILQDTRIRLRLLNSLDELHEKQWLYANQLIQNILNLIIPESVRSSERCRTESGNWSPAGHSAYC